MLNFMQISFQLLMNKLFSEKTRLTKILKLTQGVEN